jgi:hypothetical protein
MEGQARGGGSAKDKRKKKRGKKRSRRVGSDLNECSSSGAGGAVDGEASASQKQRVSDSNIGVGQTATPAPAVSAAAVGLNAGEATARAIGLSAVSTARPSRQMGEKYWDGMASLPIMKSVVGLNAPCWHWNIRSRSTSYYTSTSGKAHMPSATSFTSHSRIFALDILFALR